MKLEKRLLQQTRNVRVYLAITIGLGLLMGLLIIGQSYFLSQVIANIFLAEQGLAQVEGLLQILLLIIIARALLNFWSEVSANQAAGQVKTHLRERLFSHLQALGPSYTRGERSGELSHTVTGGVEALDAYFSQYLPQLFLTVFVPLIIVIAVFTADFLSGLILLLTAPILPLFMILIGQAAEALNKKQWRSLSQMSAHFLDVLQGLTILKLFGRSQVQRTTIAKVSERFRQTTLGVLRVAFLSALVLEMGATLSVAVIAVEIGLRLLYSQISFQSAFFVLLLAPEFYLPLRLFGTKFHAGMSATAASQRIFEILERPLPATSQADITDSPPLLSLGTIRFNQVCYGYSDNGENVRPALNGVSFEIQPGQKVALVGPSGAGKSTIAHLLLRFIEATQGEISVDGTPLQNFAAQGWRKQIAWVPQNPYLFSGTIAENIRLGEPNATLAEVIQAAQEAQAHEFIETLPQGYETAIGERGARLSGGQAQRLSLARAFLKNAPLLVLDEATSNLDPENEALVLEATARLVQNRTVLIIAHRLYTVYQADQIVVLEAGRVVAIGTHQALLQKEGIYRELVQAYDGGLV
ncbi:MAG: thiol reductant ABC exporter subunit CydD [Chloroflexi bacterium]|nr:thiol reductant ABC exporter subunit CydD [Chloroflexota bacterium]